MTCRRRAAVSGCKDAFRQYPGSAPWQTQTPGKFLPVIARSEATRQSVLLRQHKTKSNTLGKYGKAANLPRESVVAVADTPHVSACHCEPVRTLVWQSVLLRQRKTKSNTLGKYGKAANLPRESVVADADTPHVSACHCEERSDVAIRTPAAAQTEKQSFGRIRKALRICPMYYCLARYFCGETDCRTSVRTGSQ